MTDILSLAFLKHIGDYMLVETPLAKADVCLLFGSNQYAVALAKRAAELYKQGYFDKIVSSGGVAMPSENGRLECDVMRDVLIANGVPASAILIEDKATQTGENAIYSRALLEKELGAGTIKSVLALGHIHASRRVLMTLERHWPEAIKMFTTTNSYAAPKALWYSDPAFREAVLREYAKIAPYKAKGFISEIDLDKINREIATLPQPAVHKQEFRKWLMP